MKQASVNDRTRESGIDSLRCIAMTAVILQHSGLLPLGWTGVWLFYVISGYVVTKSMLGREQAATGTERLRHFFIRRMIRIAPVYYLYIAVGLVVTAILGYRQETFSVISMAGFFNNYAMIVGHGEFVKWSVGHLWTISTEMQFYAFYGISLCLLSRRLNIRLLVALLVLAPLARLLVSLWLTSRNWPSLELAYAVYAGPGLHADVFAMGALVAFASTRWPIAGFARRLFLAGSAVFLAYMICYVLVNHYVDHTTGVTMLRNVISGILFGEYREVFLYTALGAFAAGAVALAAANDPWVHWLLGNKTLQWIGTISYGGYIYHAIVLHYSFDISDAVWDGNPVVGSIIGFAISYPVVILAAYLSFRFIERPIARMSHKKSDIKPSIANV